MGILAKVAAASFLTWASLTALDHLFVEPSVERGLHTAAQKAQAASEARLAELQARTLRYTNAADTLEHAIERGDAGWLAAINLTAEEATIALAQLRALSGDAGEHLRLVKPDEMQAVEDLAEAIATTPARGMTPLSPEHW